MYILISLFELLNKILTNKMTNNYISHCNIQHSVVCDYFAALYIVIA